MQKFINGGIYNVDFKGTSDADFQGSHPTLIVRTLREKEIYLLVPLTSYKEEKMNKIKRDGFGYRIKSTNSIARIDKIQVMNRSSIKNRWKEGDKYLRISKEELTELSDKVNEYVLLSTEKALKEYDKYDQQYQDISNDFEEVYNRQVNNGNIFVINHQTEQSIRITCDKKDVHWLSIDDMSEIAQSFYSPNSHKVNVGIKDASVIIDIQTTT